MAQVWDVHSLSVSRCPGPRRDFDFKSSYYEHTQNAWQGRSADLSAYAGKTVADYQVVDDPSSPAGTYKIYYEQMSIVSTDGTVTPIYYRGVGDTLPNVWNQGQANLSASEQGLSPSVVQNNVTYYIGDQIGSARMLTMPHKYKP